MDFAFLDDLYSDLDTPPPTPVIYIGGNPCALPSEEFNTVAITLDGRPQSDLNWSQAIISANLAIEKGLKLFWNLDLGLFTPGRNYLSDQSHYLTLLLSIQHFIEKIWNPFHAETIGLNLYQGSIDFSRSFDSDEKLVSAFKIWLEPLCLDAKSIDPIEFSKSSEGSFLFSLFSRDAAVDYLSRFIDQLPGQLPCSVLLQTSEIEPILLTQLLVKESWGRLQRAVSTETILTYSRSMYGILSATLPDSRSSVAIPTAICIPSKNSHQIPLRSNIKKVMETLSHKNIPYRLIVEASLASEWNGLDVLMVSMQSLGPLGERMLRGFQAAGGEIINID